MAQPIDIQIERSLTNTPSTLLYGEPAWDDTNEHLYVGNSSGTPILINPTPINSLQITLGNLQLLNDVASPGNNFFYGTNGSGTKGWFAQTSINHNTLTNYVADQHIAHSNVVLNAGNGLTGGGSIAASRTFNVVGVNSIVANADDIQLVNDSNAPGNNYYYGTNNSGVKGWLPQPSTADLSTVRLSRTTSLNPIPTAWVDFDWTTKHVENNTAIIEYTGTPTDEIQIKEAGLYLVSWAIAADDEIDVRLTNNGVVIPGSFFSAGDKTDATPVIASNTKTIAVNLSVGILVLQVQATTTAEFTITDSASISVTRLSGVKGAAGSTGPQGPAGTNGTNGLAGPPGFGVYAWADVEGTTGTINNGLGLTVIRNSVGTYTYTFNQALPNGAYAVSVQLYDAGATDFNSFVNSRTTTSFVVTTGLGDNGGSADVLTDANHTVIVIGPGAGAPSGSNLINLRSVNTPITNTPHGTINFGPNFTVTDGGNGIANITIPTSIISPQGYIESNGGSDNAVNYNVVGSIRYAPNGPSFSNTTNFVWDTIDKQWDVNFTGRVKLSINILFTSTGNNNSLFVNFVRQRGANYTSTRIGISDIRNTGGINTDEVSGFLYFECLPGDNFHADIGRFGTNTTAANISSISTFIIERVS